MRLKQKSHLVSFSFIKVILMAEVHWVKAPILLLNSMLHLLEPQENMGRRYGRMVTIGTSTPTTAAATFMVEAQKEQVWIRLPPQQMTVIG